MMTTKEITKKIEDLKELEALIKEAEAEVEALKDELKAEMAMLNKDEMTAGRYTVRWTSVISNRLDSTAMKKAIPDVYNMYLKQTESRRFSIAG